MAAIMLSQYDKKIQHKRVDMASAESLQYRKHL